MSALSIKNLTKTYANGFLALKGIDLEVDIGGFYSLLGPNGAGKTTAIRIVCSLVEKSAGNIEVFGYNLATHPEEAKMNIGMVPQEVNFNTFDTPLNILVNQAGFYGIKRSIALKRAKKYLGELKLWDKKDDISRNLSGGMKRRLMIARALIHEPELLILDEPTAGVDIEIRRSMWKFLKDTNANGTTIILTTHYLEEAENLCRNIAIIDEGVIIENTRMIDLLKQLKQETFVLSLENDLMNDSNLNEFSYTLIGGNQLEVLVDETIVLMIYLNYLKEKNKVSASNNLSTRELL